MRCIKVGYVGETNTIMIMLEGEHFHECYFTNNLTINGIVSVQYYLIFKWIILKRSVSFNINIHKCDNRATWNFLGLYCSIRLTFKCIFILLFFTDNYSWPGRCHFSQRAHTKGLGLMSSQMVREATSICIWYIKFSQALLEEKYNWACTGV